MLIENLAQWPASTRNRLSNENYMTANFYRNTFFNQLITTTAAEGVETYVATLVFAYENQVTDSYTRKAIIRMSYLKFS